jgi:hypothetical protein
MFMEQDEMLDALRDFCDRALLPYLRAVSGASRLVERTPEHVSYLDVIGGVYPDAYVVHIVRDGRDVARSLLSQTWASAPSTMADAAEEWRSSVESAEAAARSLQRYTRVRYEELLSNPRDQVTTLYGALGLDASEQVVHAAIVEAGIKYNVDPDAPRVAEGKWRDSFSAEDLAAFMSVAGTALIELGYEADVAIAREPRDEAKTPTPAEPARKRRSLFGRGSRDEAVDDLSRRVHERAIEINRLFDRVVAAINTGNLEELRACAARSIEIRVVSGVEDWKERGASALDRFAEIVARDNQQAERQVRGDPHIAVPTATAVMYLRSPGGSALRIVAATFNARGRATKIAYYHHPIAT